MKRALITTLLLIIIPFANATVIGVGPSKLEFKNLERGKTYTEYLTASTTDKNLRISVKATGEVSDWIKFESETYPLNDGSQLKFPIKLTVPETAPNGIYSGQIEIKTTPAMAASSGAGMDIGAAIYINTVIEVTGQETVWYRVIRVSATNTREGNPIKTEVIIKNDAGKEVTPIISLRLLSHDKKITYLTHLTTNETIGPKSKETITTYLPTTNVAQGIYLIEFKVSIDDKEIWKSDEIAYVLPQNSTESTIRISGILEDATLSNTNLTLGETVTINTQFTNNGDLPVKAKLFVEIIKDNKKITTLEGENEYVDVNEKISRKISYKPQEPGEYLVRIWIEYSGTRTSVREAKIMVWNLSKPLFSQDLNFYLIAVPIVILILLWIIVFYRRYYIQ